MSNIQISEKYTNTSENRNTNKHLFIDKRFMINTKGKKRLIPIEKSSNTKMILKLKLNFPKKDLHSQHSNKSNKNIINNIINTPRNYHNLNQENYKSLLYSPILQNKNFINSSNKLNNNIHYLNNSHDEKQKIILPKINNINNKENLNDKSAINRKKMKGIFLGDLLKGNINDDIIPKRKHNLKLNNPHSKSVWHLVTEKVENNNINDCYNIEELLFNKNLKYNEINIKANNKYENIKERLKTGAERLKEIHRQKLININKLIRKTEKETKEQKNFLIKYILLMRDNFENNNKFDTEFI